MMSNLLNELVNGFKFNVEYIIAGRKRTGKEIMSER